MPADRLTAGTIPAFEAIDVTHPHHHLLTPAARHLLERMARVKSPPLHTLSPAQAKAAYALGAQVLEIPKVELARVFDFSITASDGHPLPARLYSPMDPEHRGAVPVLLYFHGGGFTVGGVDTHDILCRELSRLSDCAVVSLDYRLAPEHKFPTAADDAWDALAWLAAHAQSMGLDAQRMAVGGDSAGGTLAIQCAMRARQAGLPVLLQLLFYPGCAAHQDTPSHRQFAHGFVLEEHGITWFFNHYLRSPADREDWRFAPLLADDFSDLAPAWIGLAECDPLVDEGILYGDALRAAGVAVDLEIYRGVVHEFIKMGRALPEARRAHADAAQALRSALTPHR
jgi:acetyl esterase